MVQDFNRGFKKFVDVECAMRYKNRWRWLCNALHYSLRSVAVPFLILILIIREIGKVQYIRRCQNLLLWVPITGTVYVCKTASTETNPSVARVEGNMKKIRSTLRPSILRLFLGPKVKRRRFFAKGIRKYTVATYFKGVYTVRKDFLHYPFKLLM
jgi:hypothetical protein